MELTKEEIQTALDEEVNKIVKKYGKEIKLSLINIIGLIKLQAEKEQPREINNIAVEELSRLIPLSEWNKYHPYPTKNTLYQYSFNKEENGFKDCIQYGGANGKRILIDEKKFFEWQKNHLN